MPTSNADQYHPLGLDYQWLSYTLLQYTTGTLIVVTIPQPGHSYSYNPGCNTMCMGGLCSGCKHGIGNSAILRNPPFGFLVL